jgi:hypothetical protein
MNAAAVALACDKAGIAGRKGILANFRTGLRHSV